MAWRSGHLGLSLLAASLPIDASHAQHNLGFESETAWRLPATASFDGGVAHGGTRSLHIAPTDPPSRQRIEQSVPTDALTKNRLRISAFVHAPAGASSGARVSLWVRVEGDEGLLYIARERGEREVSETASAQEAWSRHTIEAPIAASARRVSFGAELEGSAPAWLDDFSVTPLDARELPPLTGERLRYLERGLELIAAQSLRRHEIDWPSWRRNALAQARGTDSLDTAQLALRFALALLDDHHSYLQTSDQMRALATAPMANARRGGSPLAPRADRLAATVGVLTLPGFAGGTHADQLRYAAAALEGLARLARAGACRWIVDLRGNQGGTLWPMLLAAGPLLDEGEAVAALYPDGRRRSVWYRDAKVGLDEAVQLRVPEPPLASRVGDPVAILTDGDTASAAELVAIALRARARVRVFGAPTSGAATATQTFALADGAAIVLAVAATADARGRRYTGPIVPDETWSGGAAMDAASAWLASFGGPCAPAAPDRSLRDD